jgi:hypothetical protein
VTLLPIAALQSGRQAISPATVRDGMCPAPVRHFHSRRASWLRVNVRSHQMAMIKEIRTARHSVGDAIAHAGGRRYDMKYRSINLALIGAAIFVMSALQVQTASAQSPPPAAVAQDAGAPPAPPKRPSMRKACGADITSFCPGLKGQDARKCLRTHRAEISPPCVGYLKARRAAAKAKAMSAPPGSPPPAGAPPAPPAGSDQH